MYRYPSYTNEQLVDAFENICIEWCEAINFDRNNAEREDKAIKHYDRIRKELLHRLDSKAVAS